jgi:drug/metabolite transporter (DMT)-like permease
VRQTARRPLALAGALLSVLIWSVNYPAMKVAFREMSPLAFTWWRFALATTVLVAEARLRREPILPPREGRRLALVLALSGVGVYQWLYALGLAATTSFSAAVLNSVSPLVAMLGWERLSLFAAIGSLVAWSGVALVLVYAFPAMLRQDYRAVGAGTWVILVLSSILPLVLAFRLWPEAIRTLGVAQATSLGFLTPVLAGVASALWTGERFDAGKLLAAGVVLLGLALTRAGRRPVAAASARA